MKTQEVYGRLELGPDYNHLLQIESKVDVIRQVLLHHHLLVFWEMIATQWQNLYNQELYIYIQSISFHGTHGYYGNTWGGKRKRWPLNIHLRSRYEFEKKGILNSNKKKGKKLIKDKHPRTNASFKIHNLNIFHK